MKTTSLKPCKLCAERRLEGVLSRLPTFHSLAAGICAFYIWKRFQVRHSCGYTFLSLWFTSFLVTSMKSTGMSIEHEQHEQ